IDPEIFKEKEIAVLIHIDGVQIYNNLKIQVWSIKYKFGRKNISKYGIIVDSSARAFIKCIKSSVFMCAKVYRYRDYIGQKCKKKIIYSEINSPKRTKESFKRQNQENLMTLLLVLPNFDVINNVVLDSIHLLYLGVKARLKRRVINNFRSVILNITPSVLCKFQRKKFDVNLVSRWKATQFRFFLLYYNPIVLKIVLPNHHYKYFLLLFAACRILSNRELIAHTNDCSYAKYLLIQFFTLLSLLHEEDCQVCIVSKYQSDSDDPNQTKCFAHFLNLRGETRVEYLTTYLKQSFFFLKMY
ncbi:hypothetical protein ALC53_00488, partial [Atta colombica]